MARTRKRTLSRCGLLTKRQGRDNIPAWAEGPGKDRQRTRRAEGPTHRLVPHVPFIELHMILLAKRAHLVLKTPLAVVRLLLVDVPDERAEIRRANGKHSVSALPGEVRNSLLFHPHGRGRFDLRHDLRSHSGGSQSHRKMNMVSNPTHAKTFAVQFAGRSCEIRMKVAGDVIADERKTIFRAEDDVHQIEAQRLRHTQDYMSGLQPSVRSAAVDLGLRPRLVCRRTFGPHSIPTRNDCQHEVQTPSAKIAATCHQHSLKEPVTTQFRKPTIQLVEWQADKTTGHQAPKARPHTSLGRRPREKSPINKGLKARHIATSRARLQPCRACIAKETRP